MRIEGKLTNAGGEFIANGPCEVNRERGEVTMWPSWEMHMLERERGELRSSLATARVFAHQRQAPDVQAAGADGAAHLGVPAADPRAGAGAPGGRLRGAGRGTLEPEDAPHAAVAAGGQTS